MLDAAGGVAELELAFVVVLVGVVVVPTAVMDGAALGVVGLAVVLPAGGVMVWLGEVDVDVVPGAEVAVAVGVDPLVVNARSTQYWLACQVSVGKALFAPYA